MPYPTFSIASYSFHRLLAAGQQDMFKYITDCRQLGCTVLEPWNGHLKEILINDKAITATNLPTGPDFLSSAEHAYLKQVKRAAELEGMTFGCLAVDGAHIYEADEGKRRANRARAYRWLQVAEILGASSMRVDTGGPEGPISDDVLAIVNDGYRDLITRGKRHCTQIVVENHWGPTKQPDNVIKVLSTTPGLGYLFDTHNWQPDLRDEARRKCAKFATATHIKAMHWDADGNEIGEDLVTAIRLLVDTGYTGVWGIESCPKDGDELEAVRRSIRLITRVLEAY